MGSLRTDLGERFKNKLSRASVISASRWAKTYRVMDGDYPGPWTFDYHRWLEGIHDAIEESVCVQKGAQLGCSEAAANIAMYTLDVLKRSVLYLLPNQKPDAADFTNRMFNPILESSPYIKSVFSSTQNVGHKMCGKANLYIRGCNSRVGLKSIPASVIIFDEYDEMDKDKVKLAEQRQAGQVFRRQLKVSTPSIPEKGINADFLRSTQDEFFFKCPGCSRSTRLTFPDSLCVTADDPDDPKIKNSYLQCVECKFRLEHALKKDWLKTGHWVSKRPGQLIRGFHINQLYSPALDPWKLAIDYLLSLKDPLAEQEFFNSSMGLPHIVAGAQIDQATFDKCIKGYMMLDACRPGPTVTMGIDVNKTSNIEICEWNLENVLPTDINAKARPRVLWAGEAENGTESWGELMNNYNVSFCVIDGQPETNLALQFANQFYGRVRLCRYNSFATARSVFAEKEGTYVSVNRTAWLDQSLGRFKAGTILLPNNLPRDYAPQIMSPIRTPTQDASGSLVYKYEHRESKPDHYAHARNYSEIALMFATGTAVYKDIKKKV